MIKSIVPALGVVLLIAGMYAETRPPAVSIDTDTFSVRGGIYSDAIPVSRITSVSLEQSIPPIRVRTNGFAFAGMLRGYFDVEGLGNGQLFLDGRTPPYVVVRADQK